MSQCWQQDEKKRPSFSDIHLSLENMLVEKEVKWTHSAAVQRYLLYFLIRKKQTRFSNCNLIFYHLYKIVLLYCTAKHYYSQRGKLYLNTSKYALQKEIIYFKAKWMGAPKYRKWSLNSNNLQTETISKKNDLKTETIFLFYRWKKYRGNLIYLWLISITRRGFNMSSLSILS